MPAFAFEQKKLKIQWYQQSGNAMSHVELITSFADLI